MRLSILSLFNSRPKTIRNRKPARKISLGVESLERGPKLLLGSYVLMEKLGEGGMGATSAPVANVPAIIQPGRLREYQPDRPGGD